MCATLFVAGECVWSQRGFMLHICGSHATRDTFDCNNNKTHWWAHAECARMRGALREGALHNLMRYFCCSSAPACCGELSCCRALSVSVRTITVTHTHSTNIGRNRANRVPLSTGTASTVPSAPAVSAREHEHECAEIPHIPRRGPERPPRDRALSCPIRNRCLPAGRRLL